MARTNRQDEFLRLCYNYIDLIELNRKKKEREKLEDLVRYILLIIDGKHKEYKYTLLDAEGNVISGDLFENFEDADPWKDVREIFGS